MDIKRKIQIGLGVVLLMGGLMTNNSFWGVGVFLIFAGVFNLCPSCRNGACEIDPNKKTDDNK